MKQLLSKFAKIKACIIAFVKRWLYITYLYSCYRVFYRNDDNGWFVRKRYWVVITIAPFGILLYMLFAPLEFISKALSYDAHWIEGKKRKLSFMEKVEIAHRLK